MDATKIGLGGLMLAASGITLEAAGQPGAAVALGLAGLATVTLVAHAVREARIRTIPR